MSLTRSSPSCESRRRDTASYSYNPCKALVVDLMCHSKNGMSRARAISLASSVFPVPGSPLMSSGRDSTIAAFTAAINSGVAIYRSVPRNSLVIGLLSCDAQDLHGIRTAGNAAEFALGEYDGVPLHHQIQVEQQAKYGEIKSFAQVRHIIGHGVDAAIQSHPAAGALVAREGIDRDVRADPRHPQRGRSGFGERDDGFDMQMIRRIHHRRRDCLVGVFEIAAVALPYTHMRPLILFRADDDLRHGLDHFDRMLSGSRFRGQHDRIGAVHDGVGDIRDFGAGWNGIDDHGFHHLGRHDHDFILMPRFLNDLLLQAGELRIAHFDAEVAARHHDPIAGFDHFGQILDGFRPLDFGHQKPMAARLAQQPAGFLHVLGVARKGYAEVIYLEFRGSDDVLSIPVRQCSGGQPAALAVDALVVAEFAAHHYASLDARAVDAHYLQADLSIVQQQYIA